MLKKVLARFKRKSEDLEKQRQDYLNGQNRLVFDCPDQHWVPGSEGIWPTTYDNVLGLLVVAICKDGDQYKSVCHVGSSAVKHDDQSNIAPLVSYLWRVNQELKSRVDDLNKYLSIPK